MKDKFCCWVKTCIAAAAVLALSLTGALPGQAAEQKTLRVAFPQAEGFSMTTEDGQRYGLIVDYLNEIAKYTGWEYEYIDADNNTMLDQFLAGDYDLMGGTYYDDSFQAYFAYPDDNCGYSKLTLLARKGDSRIKNYDLNSLQGLTIGAFDRNTENIRRLKSYLEINRLDCELKYYNYEQLSNSGDLTPKLMSGEIDLILGNSTDFGDDIYIVAAFDSQPHYLVTNVGNQEVLDGLNMALKRIYEADPNFAQKVYTKNFPETGHNYTQLNEKEQEYVREHPEVTVAVPNTWHPVMCLKMGDMHDGLLPDVLKKVSDYSGLSFSYIFCDDYGDALERVTRGEADILGFFLGTEADAQVQGLALTSSYGKLDSCLVRNKESSYPGDDLLGGILKGQLMPSGIQVKQVLAYGSATDALSDVNRGKIDFFYGISSHMEEIIQRKNFTNLVQSTVISDQIEIGFAMKTPVHPELFTIMNKAVNNLTEEDKDMIRSRNVITIGATKLTLSNIIYSNPTMSIVVVSVCLLLVLLAVILVSRARLHAAIMRGELERAEADSRAKSDFLSRMSHEIRTPMNAIVGFTNLTEMMEGLPDAARENLKKIKSSSDYLLNLISDILDMSRIESGKMELASEAFSLKEVIGEIGDMMTAEAQSRGLRFEMSQEIQNDSLMGDSIRLRQVIINLLSNAFKFTPSGGTISLLVAETAADAQDEAAFEIHVTDTGEGISDKDQSRIFQAFEQLGSNRAKSQGTGLGLAISSHIVQLMGGKLCLKSHPGKGSDFFFTATFVKGIPDTTPAAGQLAAPKPADFSGVHILLAEDNELNAEIAMNLLQISGADVHRVENGRQAVEQFEQSSPGTFHVILMDILMPEMSGLDAARAIRALPRPDASSIPILAMTANTFKDDVEKAMASGMTGFIPKPIHVSTLYAELQKAVFGEKAGDS